VANPNPSPSTRFKLGWEGGPGRPKGLSLTTLIKQRLADNQLFDERTPDGRTNAEWLVDCMIKQAMKGNPAYMKEIMDRNDGKTPDPVDTAEVTMESIAEMERIDECIGEDEVEGPAGQVPQ